MAESTTFKAMTGFSHYSPFRQVGLLLGLSASIALGFSVVLWSQKPDFVPLFSDLDGREISEVMGVLQKSEVTYKLDEKSGVLLIASRDLQKAKIKLASEGIPQSSHGGFGMLEKKTGFGTSQFVEQALYVRALEAELARSISSFQNIKSARVHLAIPKQASFVKSQRKPSASVFVDLYGGRSMEQEQVEAITHLVAASVSDLSASHVTVTDDKGRLLTASSSDSDLKLTSTQLDHVKNLENNYVGRILSLIEPIVGHGKARAQVSADLDFTLSEETSESYDPQNNAVRSERVLGDAGDSDEVAAGGAPGLPSVGKEQPTAEGAPAKVSHSQEVVRNFELGKTISNIRKSPGTIKRLSIAVLLDEKVSEGGTAVSGDRLVQLTELIKRTVGFDEARGDTINVMQAPFIEPPPIEAMAEPAMWEQPLFWSIVKQVLAGALVLFLILGVIKPLFRTLASKASDSHGSGGSQTRIMQSVGSIGAIGHAPHHDTRALSQEHRVENHLAEAKHIADKHPEQVAQVVKHWIAES